MAEIQREHQAGPIDGVFETRCGGEHLELGPFVDGFLLGVHGEFGLFRGEFGVVHLEVGGEEIAEQHRCGFGLGGRGTGGQQFVAVGVGRLGKNFPAGGSISAITSRSCDGPSACTCTPGSASLVNVSAPESCLGR